jgi:hypothetical protein
MACLGKQKFLGAHDFETPRPHLLTSLSYLFSFFLH